MGEVTDVVSNAKKWWNSQTYLGLLFMVIPGIVKLINPELTIDLEAGTEEVFNQAGTIAEQADALWYTLSNSIGEILLVLGIRTAAGGTKVKKSII